MNTAVVVVVVAAVAIVAGVFGFHLLTLLWRVSFDGVTPPGLWQAALGEIPAFLRIFWWGVTGRLRLTPEDVDPDAAVVVVLVHGALADGSCTTGWKQALVAAGVTAPILAPDHGVVVRALEIHAQRTRAYLDRIRARAPGAKLVFVGHSMGGLVIRRLLADDEELRAATVGVVTVASPHAGTQSVRRFGLHLGAGHLHVGHAGFTGLPPLEQLVSRSAFIASAVDAIVYPKATSLPGSLADQSPGGCEAFSFDDVGHAGLLVSPAVGLQVATLVGLMIEAAAGDVVDG